MAVEHKVGLYSSQEPEDVDADERLRARQRGRRRLGVPGPVPAARSTATAHKTKWVMVVNLNPGGIPGGSGGQYFVGDFDGTRFTRRRHRRPYTPPAGEVYADFEGADYGAWTATGTAFGAGPRTARCPASRRRPGFAGEWSRQQLHRLRRLAGHADLAGVHAHAATTSTSSSAAARTRTTPRRATARRRPAPCSATSRHTYGGLDGDRRLRRHAPAVGGDGRVGERSVDTFFGANGDNGEPRHDRVARIHARPRLSELRGRGQDPHAQP